MIALGGQRSSQWNREPNQVHQDLMTSATTINQPPPASFRPECAAWLNGLRGDYSQAGIGVLERACSLSAHQGQKRASGEPYIAHPLAVAELLRGLNMDQETLTAAILHDVVEDTDVTLDQIGAIGHGDITTTQIANTLQDLSEQRHREFAPRPPTAMDDGKGIRIQGVGDLMTQLAKCCKLVPSDPIIGYITRGRGVTIHRQDCANALRLTQQDNTRMIDVSWRGKTEQTYPVDVLVSAYDRQGLLRDISTVVANEKANVIAMRVETDRQRLTGSMHLTVEVSDLAQLGRLLDRLLQLPNVFEAKRQR